MDDALKWIQKLELTAHPEGGYFRETYRSDETIDQSCLPERYKGNRQLVTQILFLLKADDFSSFHKLESDETWHFIKGQQIEIVEITPEAELVKTILGHDIFAGELLQYTVKRGNWFAARVSDKEGFSLCACSVSPGFDFSDFALATFDKLSSLFPDHREIISQLTR